MQIDEPIHADDYAQPPPNHTCSLSTHSSISQDEKPSGADTPSYPLQKRPQCSGFRLPSSSSAHDLKTAARQPEHRRTKTARDPAKRRRRKRREIEDYEFEKNSGRWTREEHHRFLKGVELYGTDLKLLEDYIGTRSENQIRSHAQKYLCSRPAPSKLHAPRKRALESAHRHVESLNSSFTLPSAEKLSTRWSSQTDELPTLLARSSKVNKRIKEVVAELMKKKDRLLRFFRDFESKKEFHISEQEGVEDSVRQSIRLCKSFQSLATTLHAAHPSLVQGYLVPAVEEIQRIVSKLSRINYTLVV